MKALKYISLALFALALVVLLTYASEDAQATRAVTGISVTVEDTIENSTAIAGAQLTWTSSGLWEAPGEITFEWFNDTSLDFTEAIVPDGNGNAFSTHIPDWSGTWWVNVSWTAPIYDNQSFESIAASGSIINGIFWSENVEVTMDFHQTTTWVGQNQEFRIVAVNISSGEPLQGVEITAAVTTSDLQTVLPTTVIGRTNHIGELYYAFEIPVRAELEDRFMAVEINIVSIDYTGINGWFYHAHEPFYCGYYLQFANESAHPIINGSEPFNVFDNVIVEVDYNVNYSESFSATFLYQIVNSTTTEILGEEMLELFFTPSVDFTEFVFNLPLGLDPGECYILGYLRINVPNTNEIIEFFRETENFTIDDVNAIVYEDIPFPIANGNNFTIGDVVAFEVNRTFHAQTSVTTYIGFLNVETNAQFFPVIREAFTEETGIIFVFIPIPRGLINGNYILSGLTSYTIDGVSETIEWYSEEFYVDSLVAKASSDYDLFENESILHLDGTESHGYNDSYYGLRWTNDLEPNKTWYGLEPRMIFNETGNYTITLNVTDGNGNYSEDFFEVYVKEYPHVNIQNTNTQSQGSVSQSQNTTVINTTIEIPTDLYTKVFVFKDADTQEDINVVAMYIEGSKRTTRIGEITEEDMSWGSYSIVIESEDYQTYSTIVFVDSDGDHLILLTESVESQEFDYSTFYWFALITVIIIALAGGFKAGQRKGG